MDGALDQAQDEMEDRKCGISNAGPQVEGPKDNSAQIKLEELVEEERVQDSEEAGAG